MIVTVNTNGVDYSEWLLAGNEEHPPGIEELVRSYEDDDGRNAISSVTINLSDLSGNVDELLQPASGSMLALLARGVTVYEGKLDRPNFNYDPEQSIVAVKSLGYEANALAHMERVTLDSFLYNKGFNITVPVNVEDPTGTLHSYCVRRFFNVVDLIRRLFSSVGIQCVVDGIEEDLCVGGKIILSVVNDGNSFGPRYTELSPTDTVREFLGELCTAFGATWFMTSETTARFATKLYLLNEALVSEGYEGAILKGGKVLKLNNNGYDAISLRSGNAEDGPQGNIRSITRAIINERKKEMSVKLKFAELLSRSFLAMSAADDSPYYLIRYDQSIDGLLFYPRRLTQSIAGEASYLLNTYHSFELLGTHEAEITYSLLDISSLNETLLRNYAQLTGLQMFDGDGSKYFARELDFDLYNDTMRIRAIGYEGL